MESKRTVIMGCGDIDINRGETLEEAFTMLQYVAPIFESADISIGQCEPVLTLGFQPIMHNRLTCSSHPIMAEALKKANFDIATVASNHAMDWGYGGHLETIEHLKDAGLMVIGGGHNIEEARKPAIVEKNGTKFAFLNYSSVFPEGCWANDWRPGSNPMRAFTFYEQVQTDMPGSHAYIHTAPNMEDMDRMREDIAMAKEKADVVILICHWGVTYQKSVVAEYQKAYAYAAIDAGADAIIGHHPHILKPIEVYKGKPIFYSCGQFANEEVYAHHRDLQVQGVDSPEAHHNSKEFKEMQASCKEWAEETDITRSFQKESYYNFIAKLVYEGKELKSASYLPTYQDMTCAPHWQKKGDEHYDDVINYMLESNEMAGIDCPCRITDDEVFFIEN